MADQQAAGGTLTLEELERVMIHQMTLHSQHGSPQAQAMPPQLSPYVKQDPRAGQSLWSWGGPAGMASTAINRSPESNAAMYGGAPFNPPIMMPSTLPQDRLFPNPTALPSIPPMFAMQQQSQPMSSMMSNRFYPTSPSPGPQLPSMPYSMLAPAQPSPYAMQAPRQRTSQPQQSPQLTERVDQRPKQNEDAVEDFRRSPNKRPNEAGNSKSELRARFEWQGVGILEVRPNITGPDEYIDVSWEIPAKHMSREAVMSAAAKRSTNASNQSRDDTQQGDWIGLFRARQRVDDASGFILTRETLGRANYDAKSDTVRGRVRLRAPRGVGAYDFRYFSGGPSPQQEEGAAAQDNHRFPIARSPALVVEVQGCALFEALQFVEKNVRDKKRIAAAAQQLAALLRQVKTLRYPLQGVTRPEDQERKLLEEIWKAVASCVERGVALDENLSLQILQLKLKADDAKDAYDKVAKKNGRGAQDDGDGRLDDDTLLEHEDEMNVALESSKESDPEEHDRRLKRHTWVMTRRDIAQTERDRASVGSSVRGVLDEVRANLHIFSLLSDQRKRYLVAFARRYSPIDEHFFPSEADVREHARLQLKINRWGLNEDGRIEVDADRAQQLEVEIGGLMPSLVPGPRFFEERRAIIRDLQAMLDAEFAGSFGACRLVPFGSSANSFGSPNSDLDLCLVLLERILESPQEATRAVELVASILTKQGYREVDDARKTARIPIVQFREPVFGTECDICVNNPLAIRNTLLLRTYASIDERVRHVIYFLKLWAKRRGVNDPSSHTLSSYGWILLAINYMQRVGLLPVLQDMPVRTPEGGGDSFFPRVPCAGADGKIHDTYFFGDPESTFFASPDVKARAAAEARRKSSVFRGGVGQVLCGFFWDLAMTDWRRNVASVRTGEFVTKASKAADDSWRLHPRCSIEDPFETSYDVGHVLRDSTFKKIRLEAARAYALLVGCYDTFMDAPVQTCLVELLKEGN